MTARAAVVATGSELVRGTLADANGPFVAGRLTELGLDVATIVVVGDRPEEVETALGSALAAAALVVVSGGLGPTHDDRTVEVVAALTGRRVVVDAALETEIGAVSRRVADRLGRPWADFEPGVRKQASLPEGALVLGLAGTAPGLVVDHEGTPIVVLPGPPDELRRLWPRALETDPVRRVLARVPAPSRRLLRFYGVPESAVARVFADAGGEGDGVEATICARDLELELDLHASPGGEARADRVAAYVRASLGDALFAEDDRPVEELVLARARELGLSLATAESCTGGLVAGRLTSVPGASDVFLGGVVAYDDRVKRERLGVPAAVLERHGAVSAETAAAMAAGARAVLGADVAVAVTGVAGPGGGTREKPVGLVFVHAEARDGGIGRELHLRGDRAAVRTRATIAALHLVRTLLARNGHTGV